MAKPYSRVDAVDTNCSNDAFGRRLMRSSSSEAETLQYVLLGDQVIEEYVITEDDDLLARQYVWGQYVDELVQQVEFEFLPPGKTSEAYYPLSNTVYSSVALARAGTNAPDDRFVEVYDMDVYGRTQVFSAPGVNGWFSDDDVLSSNGPVAMIKSESEIRTSVRMALAGFADEFWVE